MFSLRTVSARGASVSFCTHCLRGNRSTFRAFSVSHFQPSSSAPNPTQTIRQRTPHPQIRTFSAKSTADSILEEIQEQYATARDEFEIATEETEKKSVYAEGDRAAAREQLDALKIMFEKACEGPDGNEVKRRVGQRIRELDNAVVALEESALED
jgi:hypothetical protein